MLQNKVDEMLQSYRECAARCAHLEREIPELKRLVDELKTEIVDDEVKTTSVLSDMPKGNATSDPTGKLGMKLATGFMPTRITEIEAEIAEKEAELQSILPTKIFVEAWLSGLNDRERFVVERKQLDGCYWRILIDEFHAKFRELYSKRALQYIYEVAMEKIYRIAK